MNITPHLSMPYLSPGQAQKHVTVNESLQRLDAVVQLAVVSAETLAQPASPEDGDIYILPAGKTGPQWSAFANGSLAYYRDGAWEEVAPRPGWLAWILDANRLVRFAGGGWGPVINADLTAIGSLSSTGLLSRTGAGGFAARTLAAGGGIHIGDGDGVAGAPTIGVDQSATFAWTGVHSHVASTPRINFVETDAPADSGLWDILVEGSTLALRTVNDAQSAAAAPLYITRSGIAVTSVGLGGTTSPLADNGYALGQPGYRWSVVYAGTGTISTSDAREKTDLRELSPAERRAGRRILAGVGVYQWLAAREAKGDAARLHIGVTAQAVRDAFAAEGLDATCYGLFCADPAGEGERLGVRYDQLLLLALAAQLSGDA